MRIWSRIFEDGQEIPAKYTCDGENVSPEITWSGVPESARSLALIMDDPDAPHGVFVHWLIWNIPAGENALTDGIGIAAERSSGGSQGRNGFANLGYGGPCPPSGTHRYFFYLYALDTVLDLAPGATREELERAMQGHIVAEAETMCRYTRTKGS
jgi:Raf kinase inhibitor-like YbhB/YbcL family protein